MSSHLSNSVERFLLLFSELFAKVELEVIKATTYHDLYLMLFRAVRDATELLERGNPLMAQEILINAQQAAEEAYLNSDIK